MRIIAQAVRRESEVKLTFRLNVVGKTPNRGEVCLSLREWREVELTYPRKEAYCGKNCRMDQCILLDGLETVAFTTSAWPMPVLFREKLCEMAAPYRSAWHFGPMCERADQLFPQLLFIPFNAQCSEQFHSSIAAKVALRNKIPMHL